MSERDPESVHRRAMLWMANGERGLSSECIWRTMVGVPEPDNWFRRGSYPYDPDDFNRCRHLLAVIPEWRERMPEMAKHGPVWAALAERWSEIDASFLAEYGNPPRWSGSTHATYRLMRDIIESAEARPTPTPDGPE